MEDARKILENLVLFLSKSWSYILNIFFTEGLPYSVLNVPEFYPQHSDIDLEIKKRRLILNLKEKRELTEKAWTASQTCDKEGSLSSTWNHPIQFHGPNESPSFHWKYFSSSHTFFFFYWHVKIFITSLFNPFMQDFYFRSVFSFVLYFHWFFGNFLLHYNGVHAKVNDLSQCQLSGRRQE